MLVLLNLIRQMQHLEYSESEIVNMLADLEANAFDTYIQDLASVLGFEPLSESQVNRLCESVSKWESALAVSKMQRGA